MMTAIDIVVPAGAQAMIQKAIGQRIKVRMRGVDDTTSARMFISTLSALPGQSVLSEILSRGLPIWSCEPREFRCLVSDIPALKGLSKSRLKKFTVSASGSRLRWPDEDIDLNLEAFRELSDPEILEENQELFRGEAKHYAEPSRVFERARASNRPRSPG